MQAPMHRHTCICMACAYVFIYICIYVGISVSVCVCMHVRMYMCDYRSMYVYVPTYTVKFEILTWNYYWRL